MLVMSLCVHNTHTEPKNFPLFSPQRELGYKPDNLCDILLFPSKVYLFPKL